MVNKLLWRQGQKNRRDEPPAPARMVRVWNASGVLQAHGFWELPPGQWTEVPEDLAMRLANDPMYEVGDALLSGKAQRSASGFWCGDKVRPAVVQAAAVERWPSAAIAVPVFDCPALLSRLMESLPRTEYAGEWRVLWIDNGSRDEETRRLLRESTHKTVKVADKPVGFAEAINKGLDGAEADCFVLLNQDCVVTRSDWLSALMRWMELRRNCAVAGARLLFPDGRVQHCGLTVPKGTGGAHRIEAPRAEVYYERVQAVTGACMALRASTFRALGGFSEAYRFTEEDVDYSLRAATRLGQETWYVPDAVLVHEANAVRESAEPVRRRVNEWANRSFEVFRTRWGRFVDRCAGGEVAIIVPKNQGTSALCRLAWGVANHFVICGQKTTVYSFDGQPPDDPHFPVLFDNKPIDALGKADVVISAGQATERLAARVSAETRLALGCDASVGIYNFLYAGARPARSRQPFKVLLNATQTVEEFEEAQVRIAAVLHRKWGDDVHVNTFHRRLPVCVWSDTHYRPESSSEVGGLYRQHDLLIYCSAVEGANPTMPLEAMAAGTPVILYSTAAQADWAEDGVNCLVADRQSVLQRVERLLTNDALREKLVAGGLATAKAHDWAVVGAVYAKEVLGAWGGV